MIAWVKMIGRPRIDAPRTSRSTTCHLYAAVLGRVTTASIISIMKLLSLADLIGHRETLTVLGKRGTIRCKIGLGREHLAHRNIPLIVRQSGILELIFEKRCAWYGRAKIMTAAQCIGGDIGQCNHIRDRRLLHSKDRSVTSRLMSFVMTSRSVYSS